MIKRSRKKISMVLLLTMLCINLNTISTYAEVNTTQPINLETEKASIETKVNETKDNLTIENEQALDVKDIETKNKTTSDDINEDISTDINIIEEDIKENTEPATSENVTNQETEIIEPVSENNDIDTYASKPLSLNGTITDSIISNSNNTYELNVLKSGKLDFNLQSSISRVLFEIYDSNNNRYDYDYVYGDINSPSNYNKSIDLNPGKYFIKISKHDGTGKYTLKSTFTQANNTDKEPNNGTSNAHALGLNSSVTGFLAWQDNIDMYSFNVTKSGRLNFNLQSSISRVLFEIYDSNNNRYTYDYVSGSLDTPSNYNKSIDLNPGKYYVKISEPNGTGKYTLKSTFKEANNTDKEPNNGTINAHALGLNSSVTGFLAWQDNIDMYSFNVSKSGRLNFNLQSSISRVLFEIYDSNNNRYTYDYVYGSLDTPSNYNKSIDLNPGKYYVKISESNGTGKYTLKSTFKEANNTDKEPNNGTINANSIKLNSSVTGFLAWNDSTDYYKLNISRPTRISLSLSSEISILKLKLFKDNSSNILSDYIYGSTSSPSNYDKTIYLDPGTYYINVDEYNGTGKYNLSVKTQSFDDTKGHWAEAEIEHFASRDFIDIKNNKFRPNESITRAEFIKLVNKSFGYKNKGTVKYKDVKPNDWFYGEVAIAIKAGYINTNATKFRPNDKITREEVAAIVTTIKDNKDTNLDKLKKYKDSNQVSSWAKTSVEGAIEAGYMGKNSSTFRPKANITRAESVVTLYRIMNK